MEWIVFPIIAGIVILIVGLIVLAVRMEKKRTQAFERFAMDQQMQFDPSATLASPLLDRFEVFSRGHSKRAKRLLASGHGDEEIFIFDYQYTVGGGKNQQTVLLTIAAFPELPETLPVFTLKPENFLHKIGTMFGYQDIDLPRYPDFSKRYLLRGPEQYAIEQLFTQHIIETVMSRKPICVESDGNALVIFRFGGRLAAKRLAEFIDEAREVHATFLNRRPQGGVRYRMT